MATLTKQQVLSKIYDVADMDLIELEEFGMKVSLSSVDDKAKYFLYKAIDCRKEELTKLQKDAFVENGDIDDLEIDA